MTLSKTINNKIQYFLGEFPSKEWSGPAWYQINKDEDGFPTTFSLLHFHPLDLGHGTATAWDAQDFAKIIRESYQKHPKLKKCCIGLIHSHHTMGAFFSGTDEGTLEDMAPEENFYCSLVVASAKEKYAFAFSYLDQYKKKSLYKLDKEDIIVANGVKVVPEWKEIAEKIEKEAKTTFSWGGHNSLNGYGKVHTPITSVVDKNQTNLPLAKPNPALSTEYDTPYGVGYGSGMSYGFEEDAIAIVESLTKAEVEEVMAIGEEFQLGTINWYHFKIEMNKMGLEPWHYFNINQIDVKEHGELSNGK